MKTITKKTIAEVIQETIDFYNSENRSMNNIRKCVYLNEETGTMCAVGRCLTEQGLIDFHREEMLVSRTDVGVLYKLYPNSFKEEYKDIASHEWRKIQRVHDDDQFWNKDGLNEDGKESVINLFSDIKDSLTFKQ